MNELLASPPYTPIEPVTDIYHGVAVVDPYRWLEDGSSPRTREWIRQQQQYFHSIMNTLPHRRQIFEEVAEMLSVEETSLPVRHGNYWFFTHQRIEDDQPSLYMRKSIDGPAVLLVNPRDLGPEIHVRFRAFSDDGRLVAYYVKRGGDSMKELEVIDVETRTVLPDKLPLGYIRGFQFAPDGSGFYYVHQNPPNLPQTREVRFHRLGTPLDEDQILWAFPINSKLRLGASFHRGCSLGIYGVNIVERHTRQQLYLHYLRSESSPRLLSETTEHQQQFYFYENALIVCTSVGSPNKRIDLVTLGDPREHRTIVPERASVIQHFTVIGDKLFVSYVEAVTSRTLIYSINGDLLGEVPYPSVGSGRIVSNPDNEQPGYHFEFESFAQPRSLYRVVSIGAAPQLLRIAGSLRNFAIRQVWYPARDGTNIHMFLVGNADSIRNASSANPIPVLLTGYGACGSPQLPKFSETAAFVIQHGGIFALANIRGGSEFGSAWFEAARGKYRQVSIDDFLCAAEWLCTHCTKPDNLAIAGGSNSGTLVCAAMTQRPELFRVVFSFMALLDMVRFPNAGHASFYVDELGNPEIREDFEALFAYSPYHHLVDGRPYPAVYLLSGDLDRRCDPFHSRKMAASLQRLARPGSPVVFDYIESWGHNSGRPRSLRLRSLADRLTYLAHEIGLRFDSEV